MAVKKSDSVDKNKALENAIKQITKDFGEGSIMKLGENAAMQIDVIPTGSINLDAALGLGGVPRGRIVEIYGAESSGKTTIALHIIAEAQKWEELLLLLTLNMLLTQLMQKLLEWIQMRCLYLNQTMENRLLK